MRIADRDDFDLWLDGLVAAGSPRGSAAFALASALVAELEHPQRCAPAVHIVGTAGKGTFGALLTARLVGAGLRVAWHQSPHVDDIRERFMIDGALVPWPDVIEAAQRVADAADEVERNHGRPPSFFAITAALSWELGRRAEVDVFVTEAGIGGRLDATAVLDRADTLTVLTAVGLDHTDVLGSTIEAITREKVAVVAGRHRMVVAPQPSPLVAPIVREVAALHGCVLSEVDETPAARMDWREAALATADVVGAALAEEHGWVVPSEGLSVVPGRAEAFPWRGRTIMLDGAHNPMKLAALRQMLSEHRPALMVVALRSGKDLDGTTWEIAGFGSPVVVVGFGADHGPRSWPVEEVVARLHARGTEAVGSAVDALPTAIEARTRPGDHVVVTGSFLHLGDVRRVLSSD